MLLGRLVRKGGHFAVSLALVGVLVAAGATLGQGLSSGVVVAAGGTGTDSGTGSISVVGQATIKARPDTVTLTLGVEAQAGGAAEAVSQCSMAMNRVINALVNAGVPRADIKTSNLSLWPQYDYSELGEAPRLVGYRASNLVTCSWNQLDKIGELIDKAVQAGANTLHGLSFSLADSRALYLQAVGDAVRDARAKADALAAAAGVRVGDVRNLSLDTFFSGPIVVREGLRADAGAAAPPVEPGQVEMQVTVAVEYGID